MDQSIRNKLRNVVTQCRKLLEEAVSQVLQGQFGIYASGKKDEVHVEDECRYEELVRGGQGAIAATFMAHLGHIQALGYKPKDALAQLVREIAFTHLNRLCAYKMMEAREVWIGGKQFREAVSRGMKSQGFQFYLAEHPEDEKLLRHRPPGRGLSSFPGLAGWHCCPRRSAFSSRPPTRPIGCFRRRRVLDEVLAAAQQTTTSRTSGPQDETIGWVYQYFTPKELRDQVRKESASPSQLLRAGLPQPVLHAPLRRRVSDRQHAGPHLV